MPRSILYSLAALCALAGPTWLGQVGVAEAGYQAMGIDRSETTADLAGNGAEATTSPSFPTPNPGHRVLPDALQTPGPAGAGSTGSPSGPGSGSGPGLAVFSAAPPPDRTFVTRLCLAYVRVTLASHLSSIFEPPRLVASC